jgi:hypothetical protein
MDSDEEGGEGAGGGESRRGRRVRTFSQPQTPPTDLTTCNMEFSAF